MTEIEQLRQDIATLEAAEGIIGNMCNENNTTAHMQRILKMQRQKLSRLEAEAAAKADPWREHKEVLSGRFHTQQGADHDEKLVLNYAMHLQQTNEKMALKSRLDNARIAELETRLKNWGFAYGSVDPVKDLAEAKARIDELEKQLASEKQQVDNVDSVVYVLSNDLKKAQDRIAELEAELAKRPVADPEPTKWGGKADGKWVLDGFGKPLRFYSREAAKYVFSDAVEIVPYTGDQK